MKHSMATFQLNNSWNMEEHVENSQTISVPQNFLKTKVHAIIVYFCSSLLFHTFKNAVFNVIKYLKCFR